MKKLIVFVLLLFPTFLCAVDVYNYDNEGYYLSRSVAGVSPLDGKPLIPRNATTISPINFDKTTQELKFEGGRWLAVASRSYLKAQEIAATQAKLELLAVKDADGFYTNKEVAGEVVEKSAQELLDEKINKEADRLESIDREKARKLYIEQARVNFGLK